MGHRWQILTPSKKQARLWRPSFQTRTYREVPLRTHDTKFNVMELYAPCSTQRTCSTVALSSFPVCLEVFPPDFSLFLMSFRTDCDAPRPPVPPPPPPASREAVLILLSNLLFKASPPPPPAAPAPPASPSKAVCRCNRRVC